MPVRKLRVAAVVQVAVFALLAAAGRAGPVGLDAPAPAFGGGLPQPEASRADAPNVFTGAIDAVTVFRGQAQVTRVLDVPGGAGLREIVITGLPDAIIAGSLYGESADGVEVRSVSYRIRPVGEDARESVRAAEKAVRDARDLLDAAGARKAFLDWQRQYLDKLEAFVAPAAQAELKSGILNAETLTKLTELVSKQRKTLGEEGQKLTIELRSLQEGVELRERELGVLTASRSRTAREAVVFLNVTKPGAKLRLTYLVSGADWSPSYNLRVAGAGKTGEEKATLEYQASVQQMSGEDWGNVQLTLSTATPALVATGPNLQPLTVALASPQQASLGMLAQLKDKSYDDAKKTLASMQRLEEQNRAQNFTQGAWASGAPQSEQVLRIAGGGAGGRAPTAPASTGRADSDRDGAILSLDHGLNTIADQSQLFDLISSAKVERKSRSGGEAPQVRQGDEGVSVSYKVAGRTTMPSRADQQLIGISQLELPAKLRKVATPGLTQYVYNEAQVTNTADQVLLAGPASSYVSGEFVGSAGVPTIAAGEGFRAGFGIDTSLRAGKELVERTESFQGGNRIIEFTYRLTLENFGKGAAPVMVMDRLPTPKGSEIKLTRLSQSPDFSSDKDYQETDLKKNLLRWDVTVPAGAAGTKAMVIEYRFKLEFDRQMTLTEGM